MASLDVVSTGGRYNASLSGLVVLQAWSSRLHSGTTVSVGHHVVPSMNSHHVTGNQSSIQKDTINVMKYYVNIIPIKSFDYTVE